MLKKSLSFYLDIASCALVIAGFIVMLISNTNLGFEFQNVGIIVLFAILTIVGAGANVFTDLKYGNHVLVSYITKAVAIISAMIVFALIIETRAVNAANLFTWDSGNSVGLNALYTGFAAAALYLIANIIFIVTGFLKDGQSEE